MTRRLVLDAGALSKGSLVLVSGAHPLPAGYAPALARLGEGGADVSLERTAAVMLRQALAETCENGGIVPVSGYRSTKQQSEIYESSLKENGADFTKKYVALPGCSEHETGLAIDLAKAADSIDFIKPYFPNEGCCAVFKTFAPRYGFIERYGRDKEALTGIAHEPWHFRYVGFPHAEIIRAYAFCLEEYIDYIRQFDQSRPLQYYHNNFRIDISFVPGAAEQTVLAMPENDVCQVSGNNVDGFILTQWRRAYVAA